MIYALSVFLMAMVLVSGPAYAKNDKHGHGHGKGDGVIVVIPQPSQVIIRDYLVTDARRHCPPGLAKKNPSCIPPGQAKKFRRGEIIDVPYVMLPEPVLMRLGPPPRGTQYVQVDRDVYLISEATKKVLDAVVLLSAVD